MKRFGIDYSRTNKKAKEAAQVAAKEISVASAATGRKICSECRQSDTLRKVLQCEECLGFFHADCQKLSQAQFSLIDPWICLACDKERNQHHNTYELALKSFQVNVSPYDGWGDEAIVKDLPDNIAEKLAKSSEDKKEAWKIFRQGKITNFQSNLKSPFAFIHATFDETVYDSYDVWACFKIGSESTKMKWCKCFCPDGSAGNCKHAVALLYCLLDIQMLGLTELPNSGTPQVWPRIWRDKKVETYEPMLVSEIYGCCNSDDEDLDESSVEFVPPVTREKLQDLVQNLELIDGSSWLVQALKDSDCVPKLDRKINSKLVKKIWKFVEETEILPNNSWLDKLPENEFYIYNLIEVDLKTAKIIQKQTAHCQTAYWRKRVTLRITTKVFGPMAKLSETVSKEEAVKTYVCRSNYSRTASDNHFFGNEPKAFALFQVKTKMKLHSSLGFLINPKFSFLIAAPDRLVQIENKLYLVLIKCPYSLYKNKEKIRMRARSGDFYLHVRPNEETEELQLNRDSDVYYDIQGQLLVCNLPVCFLVVYVPPDDIEIIPITRDADFINQKLIPQLTNIYFEKLLPYYVQEICNETEVKVKMEIE